MHQETIVQEKVSPTQCLTITVSTHQR